ncbi:YHYH protein [uncultured Winogradskyella sp.]|uniref:YHYH protein n=1 Tax=uncultured Winogradskyella sp. TaxID=395353 RepID=UPI002639C927|nr:YHYH protein [uncultured Winogradskyella sp.]
MKLIFRVAVILLFAVLFSCNSKKSNGNHSHDGLESHSHEVESTSKSNDYFGAYALESETYGTKTKVTLTKDKRIMVTNALPNHKTGVFPNQGNPNSISAQNKTYSFPLVPKYTGNATWAREPGIALNGIKFEPGTAEVVVCDTGENYRVEALQDVIDLGLDFNHAHVQPTGTYHYHGTPTSVINDFDNGTDLVHVGFAHDGFPMYYSKSGKYKPSYKAIDGNREGEDCTYENPHQSMDISVGGHHDGTFTSDYEYVAGFGDLDECNGITIDGNYMYLVTTEFPYISRCLMGEYEEERPQGGGEGPNGRGGRERPSNNELMEMMDTNKDKKISKSEAKGPLKDDFEKIDTSKDGYISIDELGKSGGRNR